MEVGFTGTRSGMSEKQEKAFAKNLLGVTKLHHGDCIGADKQADAIAVALHIPRKAYPCNLSDQRAYCDTEETTKERPPLLRNRDIVRACNLLVVAPRTMKEQFRGSGTWATYRYAKQRGLNIILLER